MRRTFRVLLVMSLTAACGGDEPEATESGGYIIPGQEEYVSPEDSAEAAAEVQRHSDSVRAAVLRQSGAEAPPGGAPAPAPRETPEERYRACMAQAQAAEPALRTRLSAACENVLGQPED